MLEYPELHTIARQMRESIPGKTVTGGSYLNPNANIFQPADAPERYQLLAGGRVEAIELHAPELYVKLDNGFGILFCQGGGKIRYSQTGADEPKKVNYRFPFADGGSLTYAVLLWSMGVYALSHAEWAGRKAAALVERFQPFGGGFEDYMAFVRSHREDEKQAVKVYLSKHIGGVMSAFAGEILLYAKVHPTVQIGKLGEAAHARIFASMREVLSRAADAGGRVTECDLLGNPGGYRAMAERKHIGEPCPVCGGLLEKISAGGVSAYCPACQAK